MRRLKRLVLAVAAAASLLAGSPSPAQTDAAWHPNDDDALLFETRLGQYRLGDGVRGYQTPDGVCVNLADMVTAIDVAIDIDKPKGVAQGWAFEERNQLKIDRNTSKVRIADRQLALAPGVVRDVPGGWCVLASNLGSWLGIELKPDLSNALIIITSKTKLPVQLAAERRARASQVRPSDKVDLAKLPQAKLPYEFFRTPSLDAVVTLGGLEDKVQADHLDRAYELYASGELAKMSVDARLSSDNKGKPEDFRVRGYRTDMDGGLLGPLHATHFEFGDVSSFSSPLVAQSMPGRGALITNRPIDRPEVFDRKTFRGELPTGWDAELYRNGQLLAVQQPRPDGRYEFVDVPLLFGQNHIEIVLYGPQGQIRRNRDNIAVGQESIPPEKTWYWASISEDHHDLISWDNDQIIDRRGWHAAAGVERGIDQRTSLSAQVHSLMIADERLTYVEGAVRHSVGSALIEVGGAYEMHGGAAAHAQLLAQFGNTYLTAESIIAHDYRSDRVMPDETGIHTLSVEQVFDLGKVMLPVHVEGRYVTRRSGADSLEGEARVSASLNRFSVTGSLDWQMQHGSKGPDPPDQLEAALLLNGMIQKTRLRGELHWRLSPESHFEHADVIAERPIGERSLLRGEFGYDRYLDRFRGGIGYVRTFKNFDLSVTGEVASDGSVAAGLNLALSLGPDPRGGIRVTSGKLASNGSVLARVFRDDNGDGKREPGELFEKDVQVMVRTTPTEQVTNARGEVMIDGLEPFRPVRIGVDASSLPDPLIQPAGPGIAVTPRPGLPMTIDLPLVSAGEILGTLVGPNGNSVEGVDIELVDAKGLVVATVRTDFDGYFLFEGVPYGNYHLRLTKLSAGAAGLSVELVQQVTIGSARPSVRLGQVTPGQTPVLRIAEAEPTPAPPAAVDASATQRLAYADMLTEGPWQAGVLAASAVPAPRRAPEPQRLSYQDVSMEGPWQVGVLAR